MPERRHGTRRREGWPVRAPALAAALAIAFAAASRAATLDLPVRHPGDALAGPCYAGEVLEVRLAPAAARQAHPFTAGRTRAVETARLGVAGVDAVASALGATFTPEFVGEVAPGSERDPDFTAFHVVHLPPGASLADALDRFRALPEVRSASPLAVLPTSWFPNDSLFAQETWLYSNTTPRHDIHAPEAWAVFQGDTSIVIAIADTGVLPYHPDLGGAVAGLHGNMWINWAEAGGQAGVDDDGDGYVDDRYGWDFVTGGPANGVSGPNGEDVDVEDNDPNDFCGHGTMVAGVAGAITNNTVGIAGVAPVVRLMPLRMGWLPFGHSRPNGVVRMDFAAAAIRYATLKGARVVNCSWASDYTAGLDAALTAAWQAGTIVVAASGNNTDLNYMATRSDVISVAATDANDTYWSGSETGPWLDLVARGTGICTTYLQTLSTDSIGYRQPAYATGAMGTSFAAPIVSGAVAMMQAYMHSLGQPGLTPASMLARLQSTGDDVSAANPGQSYLVPRVNLDRLITDPLNLAVPPDPVASRTGFGLAVRDVPARGPVALAWSLGSGALSATLAVYDLSGRRLREVELGGPAGVWTWDGRDGASRLLPAGMYFACLSSGSHRAGARIVRLP